MKDNAVYLLHNTNVGKKMLQGDPNIALMETWSIDWGHTVKDKYSIMYSLQDVNKFSEIKNDNKTKFTNRPKSAGEAMKQPKATVEEFLMKRSISLSNIEEFFLKRRIPLIKPLLSEREIVKLQLLQEKCRKKRVGSETRSSQKLNIEDIFLKSDEGKPKDKARDVSTSLLDSKVTKESYTREGDGRQKETEESKEIKTPTSGRSKKTVAKKVIKRLTSDKLKSSTEKRKKKETRDKGKKKTSLSPKSGTQLSKNKDKTSSKSEITTKKSDSKVTDDIKPSKSKEKHTTSKDKISGEGIKSKDSIKDSDKGTEKQTSAQQIKSEKDIPSKSASGHSKDTALGRKSNKSDKTGSSKSRKISDLPKEIEKKDKGDEDMTNQLAKKKSQFEDLQNSKDDKKENASSKTGLMKEAKKTKPEEISDTHSKGKTHKTPGVKKSVKFPSAIQHIIHYVLSNPLFIKLGWTLSPSDRAPLQMVTFRAMPATANTYCFRERPEDEIKYYSRSLEKIAYHFKSDGIGMIFYPSGVPAVEITKHDTGMRLTLFSDPKNDPLIKDSFDRKVLGIFDSYGNGVVYDMEGRKVLNYSQLEGIFWAPQRKSPYKWQWCDYKILDKQQLKALLRYMAKEQKQPVSMKKEPSPNSSSLKKAKSDEKKPEVDEAYEQILAELPYPVVQKTKTKSEKQFWGFKPITLKINSEMTLRINGQDDIAINFSSNKVFHRIDLGVKIDPDVVERIELLSPKKVSVSEVPCVFDALLNLSPSIQRLTHESAQGSIKRKHSTG